MNMYWGKISCGTFVCFSSPKLMLSCVWIFYLRGQGSDSEGEELGGDGDVILPQDLPGRGNVHSQQSVIRLSEVNCC